MGEILAGETLANLENRPWFAKLKPSKLVLIINSLLADLLICQTFFRQMLETSQSINVSPRQSFPPCGISRKHVILCITIYQNSDQITQYVVYNTYVIPFSSTSGSVVNWSTTGLISISNSGIVRLVLWVAGSHCRKCNTNISYKSHFHMFMHSLM